MAAPPPPLQARANDLAALVDGPLDVLVVGGGIVGSGAALDAATRGLRVGLVERDDIAVGTSSRSSRLIHGGLRYLEQYRFGLVREALRERSRVLHLAPHLVTIQPLLFPLFGWPLVTRVFYQSGMTLYDVLGARKDGGWHRHLSVPEVLKIAPAMRRRELRGGLLFHDGVEDDARYTLAVARTAREEGAAVVTRLRAESLLEDGGRVVGARVCDELTGEAHEIRARAVIDATGVWGADPSSPLSGGTTRLLPSRGAHLVVPRDRIPSDVGLTIRVPGKVVFLVPWPHYWLIGTTDAPYDGPIDRPTAGGDEVDELLAAVNHVLDVGLARTDVVGTYAGLRPLIAPSGGSTVTASREHRVVVERNGLVRVSGGKYTTYRLMAEQTIDATLGVLGERPKDRPTGTVTRRLIGAADRPDLDGLATTLAADAGLERAVAVRLVDRHGTQAPEVVALGRDLGLLGRLVEGDDYLEVEVAWAARHELALSLDDVLARRLRLVQELRDRGASIAPRVARILGAELGWDDARQAREVEAFLGGAQREFAIP
ncbi:MAG TPA: glycerol-3-phosphate dehydrogenase/oxidase [Candidatus Limnocylindrales bacterium]|nr:glycerol-3-phosphate dehydrogenase/oxidase [Candidatus Limnocylindrales bacterium]